MDAFIDRLQRGRTRQLRIDGRNRRTADELPAAAATIAAVEVDAQRVTGVRGGAIDLESDVDVVATRRHEAAGQSNCREVLQTVASAIGIAGIVGRGADGADVEMPSTILPRP